MYELIRRFLSQDKITPASEEDEESLPATICQYNPSSSTCVFPSSRVEAGKFIQCSDCSRGGKRDDGTPFCRKTASKSLKMFMMRSLSLVFSLLSLISFLIASLQQFSIFAQPPKFCYQRENLICERKYLLSDLNAFYSVILVGEQQKLFSKSTRLEGCRNFS